jgi:hypothetical protein
MLLKITYILILLFFQSLVVNAGELFVASKQLRSDLKKYTWMSHHPIDYRTAKQVLFYSVFKKMTSNGRSYVEDVYCHGIRYLKGRRKINIEHTWPQSKFNPNFDRQVQKADLYHLFLTDKVVNNERANFPFGEVIGEAAGGGDCPTSQIGMLNSDDYPVRGTQTFFEPPAEVRGDIARGLFYFAVKYDLHIGYVQEYFLRKWNHDDPVSKDEMERLEKIESIQGNRNPFIEDSTLVDRIQNF